MATNQAGIGPIGIIGGSALSNIDNLEASRRETVSTPYGPPSSPLLHGRIDGHDIVFIHRHGFEHTIAPHEINYRANLYAMKQAGVSHVIAVGAVGGITERMMPITLVTPDQIIDYTWGRKQTFSEASAEKVVHIDFTWPYDEYLRQALSRSALALNLPLVTKGVYAAVQGPRLETAAEIARMERDGCDIVGMTAMPEAALARELDIKFACITVVVNWAAGKGSQTSVSLDEIDENIRKGMNNVRQLLAHAVPWIRRGITL
jgi:5'-methylthioinosine phosphorylase